MTKIYEGMFLLDNEVVREDWKRAKEVVTGTLEKHGAKVHAARRWDERRLAYPIKRRRRATYLLAYYEIPTQNIVPLGRDFELSEPILRYLLTTTEAVPQDELKLSELENSADFSVPAPPEDDAPELEARASDEDADSDDDSDGDGDDEEDRRPSRARGERKKSDEDDDGEKASGEADGEEKD